MTAAARIAANTVLQTTRSTIGYIVDKDDESCRNRQ